MNHWKQTRPFTCPKCGASYVHDKAFAHAQFQCPNRVQAPKQKDTTGSPKQVSLLGSVGPCRRGALTCNSCRPASKRSRCDAN